MYLIHKLYNKIRMHGMTAILHSLTKKLCRNQLVRVILFVEDILLRKLELLSLFI